MKQYIKKNQKWLIFTTVCIMMSNGFAVALQFIKGDVLNSALSKDFHYLMQYTMLLIVFMLVECIFYFLYNQARSKFTVVCAKDLQKDYVQMVMHQTYRQFQTKAIGEYLAKFSNELELIKNMYFSNMTLLIHLVLKVIFVSISLLYLDFRIAILTFLLLTMPLYIPKLIEKRLQKAKQEYLTSVERQLKKLTDWLSNFESLKMFSIERNILKQYDACNEQVTNTLWKDKQMQNISTLLTMFMSYVSHIVILIVSGYFVFEGYFNAGTFFVAVSMMDQLSYPIISISGVIHNLVSVKKVVTTMEQEIHNTNEICEIHNRKLSKGIRLDNVCFSYDSQSPLLQNISYYFEMNKKYLIKGESGCGKTTLMNVILKYEECDAGEIYFDDNIITSIHNPYDYMVVIRQEPEIYQASLRDNVTMFSDAYDDDTIKAVLRKVNLDKFEESLDQVISENGSNLSGGEKKRICIARALLTDKQILVFDEPLANLDYDNVDMMEDVLLGLEDKTVIIISHTFTQEKLSKLDGVLTLTK